MSSKMFKPLNNFSNTQDVYRVKQNVMSDKRNLSDILREYHASRGGSYRKMSKKAGGGLSPARIGNIIAGDYGELLPPTIEAIARLLDVEPEQVMAWHKGKESPEPKVLESKMKIFAQDLQKLPAADRAFFMETIESLHAQVHSRLSRHDESKGKTNASFILLPTPEKEVFDMDIVDLLNAKTGENISVLHIEWYHQRKENNKFLKLPPHIRAIIEAYYENRLDEYLQEREEEAG